LQVTSLAELVRVAEKLQTHVSHCA
jgi:hypothetical protein